MYIVFNTAVFMLTLQSINSMTFYDYVSVRAKLVGSAPLDPTGFPSMQRAQTYPRVIKRGGKSTIYR